MKNKLVLIYLLVVALLIPLYLLYSKSTKDNILHNPSYLVTAQVATPEGTIDFRESKIDKGAEGLFSYWVDVDGASLPNPGDIAVIVTGLRGTWHHLYWNGHFIGSIGNSQHTSQHTWNQTYSFFIDKSLILSSNRFSITTYSDYKVGFSNLPFIFVPASEASTLSFILNLSMSPFYNVIFWIMLILSLSLIVMFLMSRYLDSRYALMPVAVILIAFYLLDYTTMSYKPLSPLLLKQLLLMSLYTAVLLMSYVTSIRYRAVFLLQFASAIFFVSAILIFSAPSIVQLNVHYRIANVLMLIQALIWTYYSAKNTLKRHYEEDILFLIATLSLVVPTSVDVFSMIVKHGIHMRASVYGFILYATVILITAFKHYIDAQKQLYATSQKLLLEHHLLQSELIIDELTGLGNHRSCIQSLKTAIKAHQPMSILMIDFDHFRAVNNALGHSIGDQMLQRMGIILASSFQDGKVFRYGGEEFVVLLTESPGQSKVEHALTRAEQIRSSVLMDDALCTLSQFHPVSVSIGVSQYPEDSSEASTLITKAEKACEYAKACGRNTVQPFSDSVQLQLQGFAQVALKQELQNDFVLTLAATIDLKDTYTGKHSETVARYSAILGDALALNHQQRYALRIGSLLHDLGKIAISDAILHKPSQLTFDEFQEIKKHTELGANLVAQVVDNSEIIACVKYHHEHFNGNGYPDNLAGEEIPLLARIISISDAYHAMTSTRSYRQGLSKEIAMQRILDASGTQFDPALVNIFIECLKQENRI